MGINTQDTWKCDLCQRKAVVEKDATPKGWVKFITENPQLDRDFFDHIVCDRCTTSIVRAANA